LESDKQFIKSISDKIEFIRKGGVISKNIPGNVYIYLILLITFYFIKLAKKFYGIARIRIICAKNLMKADSWLGGGASEPYVKIIGLASGLEYGETRVVYNNINPVWDLFRTSHVSLYLWIYCHTEDGITEPEATFSACFGQPFLVLHPYRYAKMLAEKIEQHSADAWLIILVSASSLSILVPLLMLSTLENLLELNTKIIKYLIYEFPKYVRENGKFGGGVVYSVFFLLRAFINVLFFFCRTGLVNIY